MAQMGRYRHARLGGAATRTLGTQTEQREYFAQVHQTFGFTSFGHGQRVALVLLVEKRPKPFLNTLGEPKSRQVTRHLNLNLNGLSHNVLVVTS
jgi:hypothetical protein